MCSGNSRTAQRRDVEQPRLLADFLRDETRRDRRAVVVQHGDEARGVDAALVPT